MEVEIFDSESWVQRCVCSLRDMPDGSSGALWRGVAYPLLPGNRIDVSSTELKPEAKPARSFAVLAGEGSTWVLVQGLVDALTEARLRLEASGIRAVRSGRWLGDMVGDAAFDWFLRCDGAFEPEQMWEMLGQDTVARGTSEERVAVLEQHLLEMRAELAGFAQQLRASRQELEAAAKLPMTAATEDASALEAAQARVRELQARLDTIPSRSGAPSRPAATRLWDELATALAAFRPDVALLRDSLHVAVGEFTSRDAFYRTVGELPILGGRPEGWKALRGAERWWERHVSTGQDDTGRAYARFDAGSRRWNLLLGWKGEQARDIQWLKHQS